MPPARLISGQEGCFQSAELERESVLDKDSSLRDRGRKESEGDERKKDEDRENALDC